ncbi:arylsulfatase [Cyclobacterium plantarum]|uniref:Arylsulfatase n=1 Tax=Cyclobacterium plantarum TaxID=2716263 RepID=A0ABX0H8K4_9BACT|nr:arylsulfatase [Cyclobacterium plantarum]NHE58214.1 arylsulfatase [Cyclobacterium plantarum]
MLLHREPLLIFILSLFCCMGCDQPVQQQASNPPNVVIFLSDDQGWGDLSHSGNTNLHTPNIDRLAQNGLSFERFYVEPVCSPTRAELLTGRYHLRGGVSGTSAGEERLDLDETTFVELFQEAGYATAAFGKWHNGMQHPYHPNARGFDYFYGFCSGHWGDYFSPPLEENGKLVKGEGYLVDDLTNKALEFIEDQREAPFLVYLPYNTPHSPMQVPDQWWDKFEAKELEMVLPEEQNEDLQFTKAALAMCENIDWNVGRVMGKLEELGLEENTIVIYLSDNGPNSLRWNGGMKGRKGSTDEGGVRSPFFMQWPGRLPAGKSIPQIAGAIDLLPTLMDLTGINASVNRPLDGKSLVPLMLEDNPLWEDRMIFSHWNGNTSVRTQRYRLDSEGRLYDMEADPGQSSDIAAEYPEIARQLGLAKTDWDEEMAAEFDGNARPFTLGYPEATYTQMPARDAEPHGNIKRSNRFPNDSFFTNWSSTQDSITWDVEVIEAGEFSVEVYYTCSEKNLGSRIQLSVGGDQVQAKVKKAHDPPLRGMENDRVERMESYVKDFKPMPMGRIKLEKGRSKLVLKALEIPGDQVMDLRLLLFKRIN